MVLENSLRHTLYIIRFQKQYNSSNVISKLYFGTLRKIISVLSYILLRLIIIIFKTLQHWDQKPIFSWRTMYDGAWKCHFAGETRNRIDNEQGWRHYAKRTKKNDEGDHEAIEERRKTSETPSPFFSFASWSTRKKKTHLYKDVLRLLLRTVLTSRRRPSVCGLTWTLPRLLNFANSLRENCIS